jgi:hypothetical protein
VLVEREHPATITHWEGVPRSSDVIDVVYDPQDWRTVAQEGVHPWGRAEWVFVTMTVLGGLGTALVPPAAVAGLLRRDGSRRR